MKEQDIQEEQYSYPYHYLPRLDDGAFYQHANWSWGFRYLGGIHVAKELCSEESYAALLDIGCGDGRFISELSRENVKRQFLGVDYSERAIALAKALNPQLDYRVADIVKDDIGEQQFDIVTLIEVMEHIPPDDVPKFVERAVSFLRPGGRLILTVPHRNRPTSSKHFQHFDSHMVRHLLEPHLNNLQFIPFDFFSRKLDLWFRLLGRTGKYFLITWQPILNAFYKYYIDHCVYGQDEDKCGRIACVGWKP